MSRSLKRTTQLFALAAVVAAQAAIVAWVSIALHTRLIWPGMVFVAFLTSAHTLGFAYSMGRRDR